MTRLLLGLRLLGKFFQALVLANLQVARLALSRRPGTEIRSAFFLYPMKARTGLEITMLADAITLTPGTLTVDISADEKHLLIHSLFGRDMAALRREIRESLEDPILEFLRAGSGPGPNR